MMRKRGSAGGEALCRMDRRACCRGRQPEGQQQARRGDAVSHPQRAIDQLRKEPREDVEDEFGGHVCTVAGGFGTRSPGTRYSVLGTRYSVLGTRYSVLGTIKG